MHQFTGRLAITCIALASAAACSKSDSSGPTSSVSSAPGSCANSQIEVLFSPMYSAFDGVHTYQVPAVVNGISASAITWSISDPSIAMLQPSGEGVMITTQKAGKANIIASAGTLCGSAELSVTSASPDDWMVGSTRYNDGVVVRGPGGGFGGPGGGGRGDAGPVEAACTSCHGDTATNGAFRTVSHTPQQTGGFSDSDLINIFTQGMLPPDAYFDDTIVPRQAWSMFHRWGMTADEAKGMVVYLRSLVPQAQKGMRGDFGGRRGDGGMGGGGGRRRDGGAMPDAAM
jgi:hypothetical protein